MTSNVKCIAFTDSKPITFIYPHSRNYTIKKRWFMGRPTGRMSRAQVAMEYMIIIGFVAVITIPLVIIFQEHSKKTSEEISSAEVYQISKRISDAAETVYYLGMPSKTTLKLYFPPGINSVNISDHEIIFRMRIAGGEDEVVTYSPVNVSGAVNTNQGVHHISVESMGGYVWVSE